MMMQGVLRFFKLSKKKNTWDVILGKISILGEQNVGFPWFPDDTI